MASLDLTDPEHVEMVSALRSKFMPPIKAILDLLPGEIFNRIASRIEMLTCFDTKITPSIKIGDAVIFISFEQVPVTHDLNAEIAKIYHLFNAEQWQQVLHNISSEFNELRKTYAQSFEKWFDDILTADEIAYGRFPQCDKKNTTLYFGEACPVRLGIVLKVTDAAGDAASDAASAGDVAAGDVAAMVYSDAKDEAASSDEEYAPSAWDD